MLDFLNMNGTGQHTSPMLIIFALSLTFLLSLLLVLIYEKTSQQVTRPDHFIQSLLLMSVVTATIMQSIGDSLALSFGIFGALAIIRFRTRISDPRDVAFIFASMAVGIACGVHSFVNGIIGTIAFSIIVIIIRFSPFGRKSNLTGELRMILNKDISEDQIIQVFKKYGVNYNLKRMRTVTAEEVTKFEFDYKIKLDDFTKMSNLVDDLSKLENILFNKITFSDENDVEAI